MDCSRQRQRKVKGSTPAHAALCPSAPSVSANDTPDGGQPDAGALELLHVVQPLEHAKELVYVLHLESDAVVSDKEYGLVPDAFSTYLYYGLLAGARVLDGVGEEVFYH